MDPRFYRYPVKYPANIQVWNGTPMYPYPMNFTDAPSVENQIIINYKGKPMLQGLDIVKGPFMYPIREPIITNYYGPIVYPISHSIPSPYQRAYFNLNRRC